MNFKVLKTFNKILLIIYAVLFFTNGCKTEKYDQRIEQEIENASPICPIVSLKETKEDCPWAAITRQCATVASEDAIEDILKRHSPDLLNAIKNDAHKENLKKVWGKSINFDEMKKSIIVKPLIMDNILKLAGVPAPLASKGHNDKKIIVHAGIIHTYGYIFSNLLTPYGYKRSRWVKDDIESGFELARGTLGPRPSSGTLFSNVTYFLSRIAFRDDPGILKSLIGCDVSSVLKNFKFHNLKIRCLEETVKLRTDRTVKLRTDLVEFIKMRDGKSNQYLLVYSFFDSEEKKPLLITAFPVSSVFVESILNKSKLGEKKPVKTRYNAFISGFTDSGNVHIGTRVEV